MYTTPEPTEIEKELDIAIRSMLATEAHALQWYMSLIDAVMTWDHMVDGDPIDPQRGAKSLEALMIEWPLNPWFLKYREILIPILVNCLSAWRHSNEDNPYKIKSYDFLTEIPCAMAFIIGGKKMVDEYIPDIRRLAIQRLEEDEKEDGGKK